MNKEIAIEIAYSVQRTVYSVQKEQEQRDSGQRINIVSRNKFIL